MFLFSKSTECAFKSKKKTVPLNSLYMYFWLSSSIACCFLLRVFFPVPSCWRVSAGVSPLCRPLPAEHLNCRNILCCFSHSGWTWTSSEPLCETVVSPVNPGLHVTHTLATAVCVCVCVCVCMCVWTQAATSAVNVVTNSWMLLG